MKNKIIIIVTIIVTGIILGGFYVADSLTSPEYAWQHETAKPDIVTKPVDESATHLPVISIDTAGAPIYLFDTHGELEEGDYDPADATKYTECTVTVYDTENDWNSLSSEECFNSDGRIRIRGNSSRFFDKKSYLLRLGTQEKEKKTSLLGLAKSSKWVLYGPCLDRTLLRNYLCYNISNQVMGYAPRVRYCNLYLNGEYHGLYLIVEAIEASEEKIRLTQTNKSSPVTSWLVRIEREYKGDVILDNYSYYSLRQDYSALDLLYPSGNALTDVKREYVENDISQIERTLYSADFADRNEGYAKYIDTRAFAQYFILNEFFGNLDAGRYSTYFYKDVRGKVKPVVWDFNNAADNYEYDPDDGTTFSLTGKPWFAELIKDEKFVEEIIRQYKFLRKTYLSDDYLENRIYGTVDYLGDEINRNFELYGYLFEEENYAIYNYLSPSERNYASYDEAVTQLVEWLKMRGAWMDENIDTLRQYSHESRNAFRVID